MIDDFDAVLPPNAPPDRDAEEQRVVSRNADESDGWRSDFRSYLDDPE